VTAPAGVPGGDEPDLDALFARATAGDRAVAGDLVTRFDERLRRIVRARLDPRVARRADADDVLQEVHVEALSRLPAYAADRSMPFFLWMRFLAVQRCAALARLHLGTGARDARRETPLVPADSAASSDLFASHLAASATSPSATVAREEVRQRLRIALDAMDAGDRDVLWLRHFEGLGNAETAEVLGIEAPAAGKRYVRALERLRDVLGAFPGLRDAPGPSRP
jgi:RNA polymerase sigma-70 factor (ECF subfamily)